MGSLPVYKLWVTETWTTGLTRYALPAIVAGQTGVLQFVSGFHNNTLNWLLGYFGLICHSCGAILMYLECTSLPAGYLPKGLLPDLN